MTANAGDLLPELTRDNLPTSAISVFITGFVVEEVHNDDMSHLIYNVDDNKNKLSF